MKLANLDIIPAAIQVDRFREQIRKHSSIITAVHITGSVKPRPEDLSFFNYLIARTHPYPQPGVRYEIPIKEAMAFMKWDRTSKVHEALDRLCRVTIEIDFQDEVDGSPRSLRSHYLSHNSSHLESGTLTFAFDTILVHFLMNPKVYGNININRSNDIKSFAAKRLYELGCLNRNKFESTFRLSVDELRSVSEVGDKHARFDNFRRLVLDKAIEEVNNVADFDLVYSTETSGQGGQVGSIQFRVIKKSHAQLLQASNVKSTKAKPKRNADDLTVDMLDGKNSKERGGPAELTASVINQVVSTLPVEDDIDALVSEWREVTRGLSMLDPDTHFLNWIELREMKKNDPVLQTLDPDIFSNFFDNED